VMSATRPPAGASTTAISRYPADFIFSRRQLEAALLLRTPVWALWLDTSSSATRRVSYALT
jgi:hypothetical protein